MIGRWHAEAVRQLSNAQLIGICDHGSGKASAIGARCGCVDGVCDLEDFIARDDLDLIIVGTPSGSHCEIAEFAAKHGKHCIVEKPLDISLERIDRMIEAHEKAGTVLGGIFNGRFVPTASLFKQAVEAGRCGNLTFGMAYVPWWREQSYYDEGGWKGTQALDGGGALMNQGIHTIDMLQWLMGPVRQVCGKTGILGHKRIEVEDTGAAVVEFESGALGVLACTTSMWPGKSRQVEVSGPEGTVSMGDNMFNTWQFKVEQPEDEEIRAQYLAKDSAAVGASDPSTGFSADSHRENISDFLTALDEGRKPSIDGIEARKSVRIILAVYESARQGGTPVLLD